MRDYSAILDSLREESRLRTLPNEFDNEKIDFSSNDYLGLSVRYDLVERFFEQIDGLKMTSSASRLLASSQSEYAELEELLSRAYLKDVLLYNSGYHANVGTVSALASVDTLIIADKLVHASIIDGIVLSKAPFKRFRHNDINQLHDIIKENINKYKQLLVITESIFSMDGDETPLEELIEIKKEYPELLIYIDEAHALGVRGKRGLGILEEKNIIDYVDVVIGTFGKACCSMGAFVATSPTIKQYLINSSRSFIFSTALPPINVAWTLFILQQIMTMNGEREYLGSISRRFRDGLEKITGKKNISTTQIVPLIIGDSKQAVEWSQKLRDSGYVALPIRKPTVPEGTERIRFSLSSSMKIEEIDNLLIKIKEIHETSVLK